MIALFDGPFGAVCAFHAAAALGYGLFRRDASWSLERLVLILPVVFSLAMFTVQDAHVTGWSLSLPLLAVQIVFVSSTWLYLREQSNNNNKINNNDNNNDHSAVGIEPTATTNEAAFSDFYMAVGSIPLLVCLFWWYGENRGLNGFDAVGDGVVVTMNSANSGGEQARNAMFVIIHCCVQGDSCYSC